jgi:hypothetical protein
LVQVLVNARGKKARRTFFPRSADREIALPEVDGNVKSGAGSPTAGTVLDMV